MFENSTHPFILPPSVTLSLLLVCDKTSPNVSTLESLINTCTVCTLKLIFW